MIQIQLKHHIKIHGEIATAYNWYFRGVHSQKNYYSGNVVDSGRYLYINSHSTPYSPNNALIEIRNNYFVYMDYYNHYIADNNGMEQTAHNFVYYDKRVYLMVVVIYRYL